jgi:hypothetical protein
VKKSVKASETIVPPKRKTRAPAPKYEVWVAEAIQQLKTAEHEYVPFTKIRQYLLDYLDAPAEKIPRLAKKAVLQLRALRLLKSKKDSYTFTKLGKAKIAPKAVDKRKKVERPEKEKPAPKPEKPAQKLLDLGTGRIIKLRTFT